jgi:hypothetical protein
VEARVGIRTMNLHSDGENFLLPTLAAKDLEIQQPFVLRVAFADKNIIT